MKTICTKCGSEEIYVENGEPQKKEEIQTLDEMVNNIGGIQNLVYKPTTWRCKKCGYSVTR